MKRNSYIIITFLQADSRNHVVGIPISVSEYGNQSMTNLTSGIRIIYSFADNDSFSENAKKIQKNFSPALIETMIELKDLQAAIISGSDTQAQSR